jgi:type II secretory pathway pseudopilin PulG
MRAGAQGGFTYIGLLLALAIAAPGLSAAGVVWHTETQRAKEAELLFIGGEFKRAIADFYEATPGQVKQFPKRLEDLLRDARYPVVRRYLRKIYVDPITGKSEWGVVATPAGVTGVYSLSGREPFRRRGLKSAPAAPAVVAAATAPASTAPAAQRAAKYSDWKFVAEVQAPPTAAAPGTSNPAAKPQDGAPAGSGLAQPAPSAPAAAPPAEESAK